jgi:hypothetical protein
LGIPEVGKLLIICRTNKCLDIIRDLPSGICVAFIFQFLASVKIRVLVRPESIFKSFEYGIVFL